MRSIRSACNGAARISACLMAALLLAPSGEGKAQTPGGASASSPVTYLAQGWSAADRDTFYNTSQGSHLIPYAWFKALRRLDVDEPFAADQLQRYGYLANDNAGNPNVLPIGFVVEAASGQLGMTSAACHTGQLEYQKDATNHVLRIDGAPANADFQQFLVDLTAVTRDTLAKPDRFDVFAKAVLAAGYSATKAADFLRGTDFGSWSGSLHQSISQSQKERAALHERLCSVL